jgi:hypothetical protein
MATGPPLQVVTYPEDTVYMHGFYYPEAVDVKLVFPANLKMIIATGTKDGYNDKSRICEIDLSKCTILRHLSAEVFEYTNLQHVDLSHCVELRHIMRRAFFRCEYLKSVLLPPKLKSIQDEAFANCTYLQDITLPQTLERLYARCFTYCYGLTRMELPASIEYIGEDAFAYCIDLNFVDCPAHITEFDISEDVRQQGEIPHIRHNNQATSAHVSVTRVKEVLPPFEFGVAYACEIIPSKGSHTLDAAHATLVAAAIIAPETPWSAAWEQKIRGFANRKTFRGYTRLDKQWSIDRIVYEHMGGYEYFTSDDVEKSVLDKKYNNIRLYFPGSSANMTWIEDWLRAREVLMVPNQHHFGETTYFGKRLYYTLVTSSAAANMIKIFLPAHGFTHPSEHSGSQLIMLTYYRRSKHLEIDSFFYYVSAAQKQVLRHAIKVMDDEPRSGGLGKRGMLFIRFITMLLRSCNIYIRGISLEDAWLGLSHNGEKHDPASSMEQWAKLLDRVGWQGDNVGNGKAVPDDVQAYLLDQYGYYTLFMDPEKSEIPHEHTLKNFAPWVIRNTKAAFTPLQDTRA